MTERLQHLEEIFADLAAAGYQPKSEKSDIYNCVAYAAGDETRGGWVYREVGSVLRDRALTGELAEAFAAWGQFRFFHDQHGKAVADGELEGAALAHEAVPFEQEPRPARVKRAAEDGQ